GGPNRGLDGPRFSLMQVGMRFAPSQGVQTGAEPLLYAATSPDAVNGAYYEPGGRGGVGGPTGLARAPRGARDAAGAARLWAEAERLTGVSLSAVVPPAS